MATHISATAHEETPHTTNNTISDALKRRAQSIINDRSIDAETRAVIRYALEINDPSLPELVRQVDAGEAIVDSVDSSQLLETHADEWSEEKIARLAEIICRAGDEPETKSAALLVLMATLENAAHPKALANMAKHFVFTRCGQLNFYGMVDAQTVMLEDKLLADNSLTH